LHEIEFLTKKSSPALYTDTRLDAAVAGDGNFQGFSDYTLNESSGAHCNAGRIRLHQLLKNNGWDINKVATMIGLGVLAFNTTAESLDGLTVTFDTVSHSFIYVTGYSYSSATGKYDIDLLFELYDAFGLDDEDIQKYGYKSAFYRVLAQHKGFTAWWQLQHQFRYAPLITKVSVTRSFKGISAV
jgi:hypothetical protein